MKVMVDDRVFDLRTSRVISVHLTDEEMAIIANMSGDEEVLTVRRIEKGNNDGSDVELIRDFKDGLVERKRVGPDTYEDIYLGLAKPGETFVT